LSGEAGHLPGRARVDVRRIRLLDKKPHAATLASVSETELAAIDCQSLWDCMEANPAIGNRVLKELAASLVARMRKTNAQALNFFAWGLQAHGFQDYLNSDQD
jgi:hypothetical protein